LISLLVFIIDIDNAVETQLEQNGQETQQSQNDIGKFTCAVGYDINPLEMI
jgi:hypothetical protein